MIDSFSIFLTHILLLVAFWWLRDRDDLDDEAPPGQHHRANPFGAQKSSGWMQEETPDA